MKTICFKNVSFFEKELGLSAPKDVWFSEGQLIERSEGAQADLTVDGKGCFLLPGLMEISSHFHFPGTEGIYHLRHGKEAMLRGGFDCCVLEPITTPLLDGPVAAESLSSQLRHTEMNIRMYGCTSLELKHTKLPETAFMQEAGVVALSDGGDYNASLGYLRSLMEYTRPFKIRLFLTPLEPSMPGKARVHEGAVAESMGLQGIPVLAETIRVYSILEMAKLTRASIHLRSITHPYSVELISHYREMGVDVTCDVDLHNLCFNDETLYELDSHFHLHHPIRDAEAQKGLLDALDQNLIQAISTHHYPILPQDKEAPYEESLPGAVGMEVALSAWNTYVAPRLHNGFMDFYQYFCRGPRTLFPAQNDKTLNYFLWNPDISWKVNASDFAGAVHNSPFLGKLLHGKVIGSYFNGRWTSFS